MLILSGNNFCSHGVSWILKSLYHELSYDPLLSELNIYITTGMNVSEVISLLQRHYPVTHSVFICNQKVQELIERSNYTGEQYYIDDHVPIKDIRFTLKKIIIQSFNTPIKPGLKKKIHFSEREKIILELLIKGCRTEMIATICNISIKTVYSHRLNLMQKSGSRSLQDLYYFHKNSQTQFIDISQYLPSTNKNEAILNEMYEDPN